MIIASLDRQTIGKIEDRYLHYTAQSYEDEEQISNNGCCLVAAGRDERPFLSRPFHVRAKTTRARLAVPCYYY